MENTDNEILNYFDSYINNNIYKQNKLEKYIYIYTNIEILYTNIQKIYIYI